jgi:hypothetical protein
MKTITLKVDDGFFEEISSMVKEYNTTKIDFIKNAINEYKKKLEKEKLRKKMHIASFKVRKSSEIINSEFEVCNKDGL